MTSRDFSFWINGLFELAAAGDPKNDPAIIGLTPKQVKCIKAHLSLVFIHDIDPKVNEGYTEEQIAKLQATHDSYKLSKEEIAEAYTSYCKIHPKKKVEFQPFLKKLQKQWAEEIVKNETIHTDLYGNKFKGNQEEKMRC